MDHPSRREVLGSAAGVGFTMGLAQPSASQDSKTGVGQFELSASTRRLLSQFELTYPIFQAPAGSAASPDLVSAVCNAGAIGGMPVWSFPTEQATALVGRVRSATN